MLLRILLAVLVIWVVLAVIGFVFKAVLWLAAVGIVLFLVTAAFGYVKRETLRR